MRTRPATDQGKAEKAVRYLRAIVAGEMHAVPSCSGLEAVALALR
jgi:hypothetical protein